MVVEHTYRATTYGEGVAGSIDMLEGIEAHLGYPVLLVADGGCEADIGGYAILYRTIDHLDDVGTGDGHLGIDHEVGKLAVLPLHEATVVAQFYIPRFDVDATGCKEGDIEARRGVLDGEVGEQCQIARLGDEGAVAHAQMGGAKDEDVLGRIHIVALGEGELCDEVHAGLVGAELHAQELYVDGALLAHRLGQLHRKLQGGATLDEGHRDGVQGLGNVGVVGGKLAACQHILHLGAQLASSEAVDLALEELEGGEIEQLFLLGRLDEAAVGYGLLINI